MLELVRLLNKFVLKFKTLELTKLVAEFKLDFDRPDSVILLQVISYESKKLTNVQKLEITKSVK
jgi:hypothetical protein